jgi:hypothetical protein
MPRDVAGKPIDPTDVNRSDGFSPGEAIATRVPGLDDLQAFANTWARCRSPTWRARSIPRRRSW